MVVDVNDRLPVRRVLVDQATEHAAPRHPLTTREGVLYLSPPGRNLHDDVLAPLGEGLGLAQMGVVVVEELCVAQAVRVRAYRDDDGRMAGSRYSMTAPSLVRLMRIWSR